MAQKEWEITVNDQLHHVVVQHNPFTSKRQIWVDDKLINESKSLDDVKRVTQFKIDNTIIYAIIGIHPVPTKQFIDVVIDSKSQTTGRTFDLEKFSKPPALTYLYVVINIIPLFPIATFTDRDLSQDFLPFIIQMALLGGIAGFLGSYTLGIFSYPYFTSVQKIAICTSITIIWYIVILLLSLTI